MICLLPMSPVSSFTVLPFAHVYYIELNRPIYNSPDTSWALLSPCLCTKLILLSLPVCTLSFVVRAEFGALLLSQWFSVLTLILESPWELLKIPIDWAPPLDHLNQDLLRIGQEDLYFLKALPEILMHSQVWESLFQALLPLSNT